MLLKEDRIWLAGIFDAAGTPNIRVGKESRSFSPYITLQGLTKETVMYAFNLLTDIAGAGLLNKPKKKGSRYIIDLYSRSLRKILPEIGVYMKRQNDLDHITAALNITSMEKVAGEEGRKGRRPYDPETIQRLLELKSHLSVRAR